MEKSFGEFLKSKRLENNLTQKELSKMLFVSESTVSKWEKDVAHPDITLIVKLSEILKVSEHELITASVDEKMRLEKVQAKRWRTLSFSWNLFFYIAYILALIPCFICNLAIDKTLSWFFIVLSSLILSFTFTNLPKIVKKNRLVVLPLSSLFSLFLLLFVVSVYTKGEWLLVSICAVFLGFCIVFVPIYISKCGVFRKIKRFNDFISIFIDFILLNILLITVERYVSGNWYLSLALPVALSFYLVLNLFLCVRFLKVNGLVKASIIMFMINLLYFIPSLIKVQDEGLQRELNELNVFKADFSRWIPDITLENNVHLIIFLTVLLLGLTFLAAGLFRKKK